MNMQDIAGALGILTAVQQEYRVQPLGNLAIIGLLEAPSHGLASGAVDGKQLLMHGLFP